jgi:hypothetical protein
MDLLPSKKSLAYLLPEAKQRRLRFRRFSAPGIGDIHTSPWQIRWLRAMVTEKPSRAENTAVALQSGVK